ncbi:MAG: DUF3618 domain-containing protein [Pseudomonadota bacterium]
MSTSTSDFSSDKSPETLEREIEQKRANINNIVNALENKLSPGEIVDTALNFARGNGGEFFGNLGKTIKANPVPTLLTSVGLLWMIAGQNRRIEPAGASSTRGSMGSGLSSASSKLGSMASDVSSGFSQKTHELKQQGADLKAKGENLVHKVSDTLGSTRERLSGSASHAAQSLRHQADRARDGYEHLLQEQPLVLGAVGIAVGALLGATLPRTHQEDRLLGSTSDALTRKAKALAEQGYAKAEGMVKEVMSEGTSSTSSSTPYTPGSTGQPAHSTASTQDASRSNIS